MQSIRDICGLRTVVVRASEHADAIVILLHGYAMAPEDLSPFAASMKAPAAFYFPQAPFPATPTGFAWWAADQARMQPQLQTDARDLHQFYPPSRGGVRAMLMRFISVVKLEHPGLPLILAGFSQGGMLCCDLLLHEKPEIAGLAMLSSSRIAIQEWIPRLSSLKGLPVLVSHGQSDPDLAFAAGNNLRLCMTEAGADVTWIAFAGAHEIPLIVWRGLRKFICRLGTPIRRSNVTP